MRPITINTKAGIQVCYTSGPMARLLNRKGTTTGQRFNGMLAVDFNAGHNRCAERVHVWPKSLERCANTVGKH